ncbi:hypothetical protein DCAR_0101611 [Daucus carota subsp. sativus]|uniref:Uncharacterized protein n=1 Tax=Daucus carota subsp. sativus TaxID=79200 RepID=A0A161YGC1_DAUCS|nr:hypothetical protein DCAR_0101611 [Daucus carota subsp. sativus]
MGPIPCLTEEQAIMAQKHKWDLTHIETTDRRIFETISMQEYIMLQDNQLEAYGLFNTIHANNFKEGKTYRRISCVTRHMNSTVEYMVNYGMNNLIVFSEVQDDLGDMRFLLNRDMGMVFPSPIRNGAIFGTRRGKTKMYTDFSFNKNGVLCDEAIKSLDEGKLTGISSIFSEQVVYLDTLVGYGMYGRDILHYVVNGTLPEFICQNKMLGEMGKKRYVRMDVDKVMEAMDLKKKIDT